MQAWIVFLSISNVTFIGLFLVANHYLGEWKKMYYEQTKKLDEYRLEN